MTEPTTQPPSPTQAPPCPADLRPWAEANQIIRTSPLRFGDSGEVEQGRRFAFYGRTAACAVTEVAVVWERQFRRAQSVLAPFGGQIVTEYFDHSTPITKRWSQRLKASALLDALGHPGRDFDAVVLGEGCSTFFTGPYKLVLPVFAHHRVPLWIPDVDRLSRVEGTAPHMVVQLLAYTTTDPAASSEAGEADRR